MRELREIKITGEEEAAVLSLKKLYNKRAAEAAELEETLKEVAEKENAETIKSAIENIIEEAEGILKTIEEIENSEGTARSFNPVAAYSMAVRSNNHKGEPKMENNEIRAFQKFLSSGAAGTTQAELRSLSLSGTGAFLPKAVMEELITSTKWSDLLHRAKVFNVSNVGVLKIPVVTDTEGSWHEELADGREGSPVITSIELNGYELMRWTRISVATFKLAAVEFVETMLGLLSNEVVQTLEKSFINGDGNGKPLGLEGLEWTEENSLTASGVWIADIAKAIGMLPAQYARNCVLLMNTATAYDVITNATYDNGTPVFSLTNEATNILGKEIVMSEHCADGVVYVVDPSELYVRFGSDIACETDKSSGFTSAAVDLRALTVVDAAWNTDACIRIKK